MMASCRPLCARRRPVRLVCAHIRGVALYIAKWRGGAQPCLAALVGWHGMAAAWGAQPKVSDPHGCAWCGRQAQQRVLRPWPPHEATATSTVLMAERTREAASRQSAPRDATRGAEQDEQVGDGALQCAQADGPGQVARCWRAANCVAWSGPRVPHSAGGLSHSQSPWPWPTANRAAELRARPRRASDSERRRLPELRGESRRAESCECLILNSSTAVSQP